MRSPESGVMAGAPSPQAWARAASSPSREGVLAATGLTALAVGLLCYVAWRAPGTAQWLPAAAALGSAPGGGLSGLLVGWLPSLVHPFAFALLTAAASRRSPAFGACAGWWLVGIAFEALQHPAVAAALPELADLPQPLLRFAAAGRFDVGDLVATTLGALAAARVLVTVERRSRRLHEQA
jgi:hypothetical protein